MNQTAVIIPAYLTVAQFCEKHTAYKIGGVRDKIFNAETNGLAKSGAIVRDGRKILINESKCNALTHGLCLCEPQ